MATERVFGQGRLHPGRKTVETRAHGGHTGCDPDARGDGIRVVAGLISTGSSAGATGTQLAAPLEQHIGVDVVLLRQLGNRDTRCASLDGGTSLEVGWIAGAALAVACCCICIQSDSHQKSDGNYFWVCVLLKIDGDGKTLTPTMPIGSLKMCVVDVAPLHPFPIPPQEGVFLLRASQPASEMRKSSSASSVAPCRSEMLQILLVFHRGT